MFRKNLVLEVNAKMLLANQIVGFLNSNIWKIIRGAKLHAGAYLLKLQIDDVTLHEWGQACTTRPKSLLKP